MEISMKIIRRMVYFIRFVSHCVRVCMWLCDRDWDGRKREKTEIETERFNLDHPPIDCRWAIHWKYIHFGHNHLLDRILLKRGKCLRFNLISSYPNIEIISLWRTMRCVYVCICLLAWVFKGMRREGAVYILSYQSYIHIFSSINLIRWFSKINIS